MTLAGEDLELFERSLRAAVERHSGASLDGALAELGWSDALEEDERAAIELLFGLQGAHNATSHALERALLHSLDLGVDAGTRVVLPTVGQWQPPGQRDGDRLRVRGLAGGGLDEGEHVLVVAGPAGDAVAFTVDVAALDRRPVHGLDPSLGLIEVTGQVSVGQEPLPCPGWSAALRLGRLATAHELVGASRTMLSLAREHALERIQFGVPIASFQAVRHRLAETLVAIETASALLDAAWLDGTETTATMAKATAGREARVAARHCQQVLAGIGFTTEHDLHRHVRRVLVLDGLFGSSKGLAKAVGDRLVSSRRLPPLLPL